MPKKPNQNTLPALQVYELVVSFLLVEYFPSQFSKYFEQTHHNTHKKSVGPAVTCVV